MGTSRTDSIWGTIDFIASKVILRVIRCTCNNSENTISETLILLQLAIEIYQTSPELSSQWSSQTKFSIFEILTNEIVMIVILLFWLTWGPMRVQISKPYSYKEQPKHFQTFPEFSQ